jgi:lysophospholipase L1-like esterase
MQNSRNKLIVLTSGIIASLIFLEIFLRIVGFVHLHGALKDKIIKKERDTYVILCVGDSLTRGIGARRDKDYPSQLKDIFNKETAGAHLRIINRGIGGYNTTMILNRFERYLKETNPDLIILLAGIANSWNSYGYRSQLYKKNLMYKLRDALYDIKIFKFIKSLSYEIKYKVSDKAKHRTLESAQVEDWFRRAYDCEQIGKYDKAIMWNKKIIENLPNSADVYHSIGRIYLKLGDRQKARQFLMKAIEIQPDIPQFSTFFAFSFLRDPVRDKEDLQFLQKYINVNPAIRDIVERTLDQKKYYQEVQEWIRRDIAVMIRVAKISGIAVLLQNYPNYNYDKYMANVNMILKEIAQEYSVPFVDNAQVFQELILDGGNRDNYFSLDKIHCNELGYGIMAENIYNCIQRNKLIK